MVIYLFAFIVTFIMFCLLNVISKNNIKSVDTNFAKKKSVRFLNRGKVHEVVFLFLTMLPLILISALRYGIGTDYFTYISDFSILSQGINKYGYSGKYEWGYFILNWLVGSFTSDGQAIIAVVSIIFLTAVFWSIYKISKDMRMSFLIFILSFVYFISLNNARQSLASAFALIGIVELISGNKKWYFIWTILAGLIHQAALISFALFFFTCVDTPAILLLLINVVWVIVYHYFVPFVLNTLIAFQSLFPALNRINFYLNYNIYTERTVGKSTILFNYMLLLVIVLIECIYQNKETHDTEWKIIKYNQFLLLFVFSLDGALPAIYRIARLFSFAHFIYIPNALARIKSKKDRWLIYTVLITALLVLFCINVVKGAEQVIPYQSIWTRRQ